MAEGRDPVEVLAEDFIQRRRGGEDVSIEGYAQEHPELATQIRELFPALLFMETQSGEDEDDAIGSPPPEQFGSYRILEEIGHGGMGRVYLALDSKLDRQIALKLLPEKFSDDAMRAAMFGREAKTAAHLNHPNIATVHEMGEVDRRHFIAMEYVAGRSLGELLLGREPLSLEDLLPIAIQIAEGLGAAHKQNIIHRDLKPANIMLTEEGRVKILDFGLAKALGGEVGKLGSGGESLNTSEVIVGTPGYMSPEQARGGEVDARTDLFSLGMVLYEMATGLRAFHRASVAETLSALLTEDPPGVTAVNPKLPVGLERLIGKLLEKRVEDRFGSAVEVLEELQGLVPGRVSKSRRFLRVAMGVAALVVAGVGLVWLFAEGPWRVPPKLLEEPQGPGAEAEVLPEQDTDNATGDLPGGQSPRNEPDLENTEQPEDESGKSASVQEEPKPVDPAPRKDEQITQGEPKEESEVSPSDSISTKRSDPEPLDALIATWLEFRDQARDFRESIGKRRLEESKTRLRELEKDFSAEFPELIGELQAAFEALEGEELEKEQLRKLYERFRALLGDLETDAAEEVLEELEKGWRCSLDGLDESLEEYPEEIELLLERAQLHLWLDEFPQAETNSTMALDLAPSIQGLLLRGKAKFMRKMLDEALADFDLVLNLDADNRDALYWRGVCMHRRIVRDERAGHDPNDARLQSVLREFEKAIGLLLDSSYAYDNTARLYDRLKKHDEARVAWRAAYVSPFTKDDLLANLEGNRRALELARDVRCEALTGLAESYLWNNESKAAIKAAIDACERALELNPRYGRAHLAQAHAYYFQNQPLVAIRAAERAREYAGIDSALEKRAKDLLDRLNKE